MAPSQRTDSLTRKPVWLKLLLGALLLGLALCVLLWGWWSKTLNQPYPVSGQSEILTVNQGETYSTFITQLAKKHHLSATPLKLYQKFFIKEGLKTGVYEVKSNMTVKDVLQLLSDGRNAQMNRVVLIDGTTFKQFKAKLQQDNNVKKTVLDLPDAEIMRRLGAPYAHPEGLFNPNTYYFAKGETDLNILKQLYREQMNYLDQAWSKRDSQLPYKDKYDALIMASIIEKETSVERERKQVASVFINRLRKGMRLQTDPTVIYGMGDRYNGNITREDLTTPTAYNTYTIDGLPPTPIAMPSRASIEAAMHPDQTDYIFFVATGNGGHTFTTNLSDHNQAVKDYLAVMRQKRQGS